MSTMIDLAERYKLPTLSTQEGLETRWSKVLRFVNRVLVSGHCYNSDGKLFFGAVYEFLDDYEHTCEDFIGLIAVSQERFEDDGHTIEWALNQK